MCTYFMLILEAFLWVCKPIEPLIVTIFAFYGFYKSYGIMKMQGFNIANFKIDGGAMFGVVPKMMWHKRYPADENNLIPLSLRSLVIETEGRVILIDDGIGDKQDEKFFSHVHLFGGDGLVEGLAKLGYTPSDITDVILTHLHYDHCGGTITLNAKGEPELTFPNAKVHVSREQWEWAINPNMREADSFLKENLLPIKELGALNLIAGEGWFMPGIELRFFGGHTKGQMVPIIHHPSGKTLVFAADLFPFSTHIHPVWNMSYDVEPLNTMIEKEAFVKEAFEKGYVIYFQHDYYNECATLISTPKGVRAGEFISLEEVLG